MASLTAGAELPVVTMTSTLSLANSAAISAPRSLRPSAQRYSIVTLRPSIQPSSRNRCTKAAVGNNFAQKFESLGSNIGSLERQAGDVTARPRQTHHETIADRVPCQREDDRYDRCRPLCCQHWCGSGSDNDVNLEPDKLGCDLAKSVVASLCPPIFDCYVAALDP